jgi:hypothetical protein
MLFVGHGVKLLRLGVGWPCRKERPFACCGGSFSETFHSAAR